MNSQLSQTFAERVNFFHLLVEDDVKKKLVEHTFILSKMIHFVLQRFNLQQFFHVTVVSKCIIDDCFDEHHEHRIAEK